MAQQRGGARRYLGIRSCPAVLPVDNISINDIRFPSEANTRIDPLLLHLNIAFSVLSTAVCFQGIIPEGPRTMWLTTKYTCPTRFSFTPAGQPSGP